MLRSRTVRRSRAQGYVEFGIAIAVLALVSMVGLDRLRGAVYMYFTGEGMADSLNPPAPPVPGQAHSTVTTLICQAGPWDNNTPYFCTAKVEDPSDPSFHPTNALGPGVGVVTFSTSAIGGAAGSGAFTPGTCTLQSDAPAAGSSCAVPPSYFATNSGRPDMCLMPPFIAGDCDANGPYKLNVHTLKATYSPPMLSNIIGSEGTLGVEVKRTAGVRMRYPAAGALQCSDTTIKVGDSTTCMAWVVDTDTGGKVAPQGQIDWFVCLVGGGGCSSAHLSAAFCNLIPFALDPSYSQCGWAITFTPTPSDVGARAFRLHYSGDALHSNWGLLSGPEQIAVLDATTTTLASCLPSTVALNTPTTCHVEVTNTTGSTQPKNLAVSWSATGGPGTFSATTCTTSASGPTSAACDIQYTPTSLSGTRTITAHFAEQGDFAASDSDGPPNTSKDITVS